MPKITPAEQAYNRKWNREHLEQRRLLRKRHYYKHKDEIAEHRRIKRLTTKEVKTPEQRNKVNDWKREQRKLHPETYLNYYQEHKEHWKEYAMEHEQGIREYDRLRNLEFKKTALSHYGKNGELVCVRCGFDDIRALTIDHINGGGRKHVLSIHMTNIYLWLIRNDYPDGFQTLCMNCQWIKRFENTEYAHNKHKKEINIDEYDNKKTMPTLWDYGTNLSGMG